MARPEQGEGGSELRCTHLHRVAEAVLGNRVRVNWGGGGVLGVGRRDGGVRQGAGERPRQWAWVAHGAGVGPGEGAGIGAGVGAWQGTGPHHPSGHQ